MTEHRWRPFAWLLCACVLPGLAAPGCTTNPATGDAMFTLVTADQERAIGAETHRDILYEHEVYEENPGLNAWVASIAGRIHAASEMSSEVLTVTLLDSDKVNAFALPGGYIYVTRGLLALANNEAELAGVIGHEIGHITARHGAQRMTWALLANVAVSVVDAASRESSYGGLFTDMTGLSARALAAGYSREQEIESDSLGIRYLTRAGYDPYAMVSFLEQLGRHADLSRDMSPLDEDPSFQDIWFSTHPRTPERVLAAANVTGAPAGEPLVNRDGYLRMIDGMVYGDGPGDGYVRGRHYIHPEWRFAFDAPDEFAMFRVADEVRAHNDSGTVVVFRTIEDIHAGMAAHLRDWADTLLPAFTGLQGSVALDIAGFEAAAGGFDAWRDGRQIRFHLVAVALNPGRIARFLFAAPVEDAVALDGLVDRTIASFRRLSAAEAAATDSLRVRIVEVGPADSIESLASLMAYDDFRRERFMVLNGIDSQAELQPGMFVKVIR